MNGFAILVDIVALALTAIVVIHAYKTGLLRALVMFAGVIVSVLIAAWGGKMLSGVIYNAFIRDAIVSGVDSTIVQGAAASAEELTSQLLVNIPEFFVKPLVSSAGGEAALAKQLGSAVSGATEGLGAVIADNVVGPVAISMIQFIVCLLIFFVCVIIVKIAASLVTHLRSIPVIGPVNAFLGGVVGLLQAALLLFVLGIVCRLIISVSGEGIGWLNTGVMESTLLFRHFYFLF